MSDDGGTTPAVVVVPGGIPVVGQEYRGSIVKGIQEEITERPNGKIRKRYYLTLSNGMMMMEDFFEDKINYTLKDIKGDYNEIDYNSVITVESPAAILKEAASAAISSSDDDDELDDEKRARKKAARKKAKEEMAARKAKKNNPSSSPPPKEEHQDSTTTMEEKENDDTNNDLQAIWVFGPGAEEDDEYETFDDTFEAQKASFTTFTTSPTTTTTPTTTPPSRGVWKLNPSDDPNNTARDWKAQNVTLYPKGKQIPNKDQVIHGIWGYKDNKDKDENNKKLSVSSPEIYLYPPGITPSKDDHVTVQGEWAYTTPNDNVTSTIKPTTTTTSTTTPPKPGTIKMTWPPPIDETKKLARQNRLEIAASKVQKLEGQKIKIFEPQKLKVYPKSKLPKKAWNNKPQGCWTIPTKNKNDPIVKDIELWKVQDIMVYAKDNQPDPKVFDMNHPKAIFGAWGYRPGMNDNNNSNGFHPKDILVCPPGMTPDDFLDGFQVEGIWTVLPGLHNIKWPPINDSTTDIPTNKFTTPTTTTKPTNPIPFHHTTKKQSKPKKVTVYPSSKKPQKAWKPTGVWTYFEGHDGNNNKVENDTDWKPIDLMIYPPGEEPSTSSSTPSSSTPSSSSSSSTDPKLKNKKKGDDNETEPTGVWGYKEGTEPNIDGTFNPQDIWVCPPGVKPSPSSSQKVQGIWTFMPGPSTGGGGNGTTTIPKKQTWPPPSEGNPTSSSSKLEKKVPLPPKTVQVLPKSKLSNHHRGKKSDLQGIWNFNIGSNDDEEQQDAEDWKPQQVLCYETGHEPEILKHDDKSLSSSSSSLPPHGYWGYSPGAEPNDDGSWNPEDIWFLPPGTDLPKSKDDGNLTFQPRGVWMVDPKALNVTWPPPKVKPPQMATVYPKGKAPTTTNKKKNKIDKTSSTSNKPPKDDTMGTWIFGQGDNTYDEECNDWMPQQVLLHDADNVPDNLTINKGGGNGGEKKEKDDDDSPPHGMWGYSPGTEPDEDGCWNPEDIWFCTPGSEPPKDYKFEGVWESVTPEGGDTTAASWPPPKVKPPQKATVYPKGKTPKDNNEGAEPMGTWIFGNGDNENEDDGEWNNWMPQPVLLYETGSVPENLTEGSGGEDAPPHGMWGYAAGAEPDEDGCWNPDDMWFCTPGAEPPKDAKVEGVWAFGAGGVDEGDVDAEWPPPLADDFKIVEPSSTATPAKVYPKIDVPKDKTKGVLEGTWACGNSPDEVVESDDWLPQQVLTYPTGQEPPLSSAPAHGIWGYAEGAEPDADGDWNPKDVVFFTPDASVVATPKDEKDQKKNIKGVWTLPPGGPGWPPAKKKMKGRIKVVKDLNSPKKKEKPPVTPTKKDPEVEFFGQTAVKMQTFKVSYDDDSVYTKETEMLQKTDATAENYAKNKFEPTRGVARHVSAPAASPTPRNKKKVIVEETGYDSSDNAEQLETHKVVRHSTMSGWVDPFSPQPVKKKKKKRGTYI